MIATEFRPENLKALPLRAIVALAARCARRAQAYAGLADGHPDRERFRAAVDAAVRLAEDFAGDRAAAYSEQVAHEAEECRKLVENDRVPDCATASAILAARAALAAHNAHELADAPPEHGLLGGVLPDDPLPHLAVLTADLATRDAFLAASEAADAMGHADRFIRAAVQDAQKLVDLHLGTYPQLGKPIDPSPSGPLGPLEARED